VCRVRCSEPTRDPDYDRLFAICDKVNHGNYSKYQLKTDRPIPVVVLSPR